MNEPISEDFYEGFATYLSRKTKERGGFGVMLDPTRLC